MPFEYYDKRSNGNYILNERELNSNNQLSPKQIQRSMAQIFFLNKAYKGLQFKDIEGSKGDIRKIPHYDDMNQVVQYILSVSSGNTSGFTQLNQITNPNTGELTSRNRKQKINTSHIEAYEDIQEIDELNNTLLKYKTELTQGFANDVATIKIFYNSMVAAWIVAITNFISLTMYEENKVFKLDLSQYKSKDNRLVIGSLRKFNELEKSGNLRVILSKAINSDVKTFTGFWEIFLAGGVILIGSIVILFVLIALLRELIYYYFFTRVVLSDRIRMVAYFIQLHALSDGSKSNQVSKKQLEISDFLYKISDKISVDINQTTLAATKKIQDEDKQDLKKVSIDKNSSENNSSIASSEVL